MAYTYYVAYDDGDIVIRWNNLLDEKNYKLERYNNLTKEWIEDYTMCGIYSGDIPARVITKEEAEKLISA